MPLTLRSSLSCVAPATHNVVPTIVLPTVVRLLTVRSPEIFALPPTLRTPATLKFPPTIVLPRLALPETFKSPLKSASPVKVSC